MVETTAEAQRPAHGAAVFDVAQAFLSGEDALALIRARGAKIDDSFASTGQYPFEAAKFAARGSSLSKGAGAAPDTLKLVLPGETTLRFADASARLGAATRLPALPGTPWQYGFAGKGGRIVVVLSDDPKSSASRLTRVTAIREG